MRKGILTGTRDAPLAGSAGPRAARARAGVRVAVDLWWLAAAARGRQPSRPRSRRSMGVSVSLECLDYVKPYYEETLSSLLSMVGCVPHVLSCSLLPHFKAAHPELILTELSARPLPAAGA